MTRSSTRPSSPLPTHFSQKPGTLLRAMLGARWHAPGPAVAAYERAYEQLFPGSRAFSFWKGRVALHVGLRGMGIGAGDEVILPGYTCSMVPSAIVYTGAKCAYVDIRERDYNVNPDLLEAARTERTRVVIVQHTYGYPADMDRIVDWADDRGLAVVEDCCHALGCTYQGRALGTFGRFAFFSSQWNKHYTTALGGVLLVNDAALGSAVETVVQRERVSPTRKQAWMLAAQMLAHHLLVYPRTILLAQALFRRLTAMGLVIGSATADEFETTIPPNYLMGMSDLQARIGLCELARLGRNVSHRRRLSAFYRDMLGDAATPEADQPLVRYPLRVSDRERFLADAMKVSVEVGTWFECPLHPAETDPAVFDYRDGMCPVSERVAAEMVNLPTHLRISRRSARRFVEFARKYERVSPARPVVPVAATALG